MFSNSCGGAAGVKPKLKVSAPDKRRKEVNAKEKASFLSAKSKRLKGAIAMGIKNSG